MQPAADSHLGTEAPQPHTLELQILQTIRGPWMWMVIGVCVYVCVCAHAFC